MHFRSFEEFWPFYVNQHTKASTRRWHFCATGFATLFLIAAIAIRWWLLFFAPVFGYGLAWYSHFFIEGNTPASFGHPIWSFLCDYKMFVLMLTGRMDRELKRLGKRPMLQLEILKYGLHLLWWLRSRVQVKPMLFFFIMIGYEWIKTRFCLNDAVTLGNLAPHGFLEGKWNTAE